MSDSGKVCSELGIPKRLHANGRIANPNFDDDEVVYRRFFVLGTKELWSLPDNDPTIRIFDLSEDSYNRSKYCESPEDVLYNTSPTFNNGEHFKNAGILAVRVSELHNEEAVVVDKSAPGPARHFTIRMQHEPNECMYPHSISLVLVNGDVAPKRPPSIKRVFRKLLLDHLDIIKPYSES